MKKLLTALFVAFSISTAFAAKINWLVSGIPAIGADASPDGYWVYCFLTSDSSGQNTTYNIAELTALLEAGVDPYDAPYNLIDGGFSNGAGYLDWTKEDLLAPSTVDIEKEDTWVTMHAAAIVIDGETWADSTMYKVIDCGDIIINDLSTTFTAIGDWQSVPEPTSGLLLLLGLCGVGLKRKRA